MAPPSQTSAPPVGSEALPVPPRNVPRTGSQPCRPRERVPAFSPSTVEDGPLCPSDSGSLDLRFSTAQDQGKCRSKTPGLRAWPVLPLSGVPASLSDSCPEVKGSYRLCSGGRGVTARGREGPVALAMARALCLGRPDQGTLSPRGTSPPLTRQHALPGPQAGVVRVSHTQDGQLNVDFLSAPLACQSGSFRQSKPAGNVAYTCSSWDLLTLEPLSV